MYLYSVGGNVLFKSSYLTIKESVEEAVRKKIDLHSVNLRKANLKCAELDGAFLKNACLWGADLTAANLCEANLESSDCRTAIFKDTCLAEANCYNVNFHGAYFAQTIFSAAHLAKALFSCPSLFTCDLSDALDLKGAIYAHRGEINCALDHCPVTINGCNEPVTILKNDIFFGLHHVKRAADQKSWKRVEQQILISIINHLNTT